MEEDERADLADREAALRGAQAALPDRAVEWEGWLERGPWRRNLVARVVVDGEATAVVKGPQRPWAAPAPDAELDPHSPAACLANEVAALAELAGRGGPALLGHDWQTGWLVLEDVGDGPSLADVLRGDDPGAADAALVAWAGALAALHTATADGHDAWAARRGALPGRPPGESATALWAAGARGLAGRVEEPAGLGAALAWVDEVLADRRWWALSPRDACPDNNQLRPDGRATLIDFEGGGFRHALLDPAYLVVTMPTCWCVGRWPEASGAAALAAYRAAAPAPEPAAIDLHLHVAATYHGLWSLLSRRAARALQPTGADRLTMPNGFVVPSGRENAALAVEQLEAASAVDARLAPVAELARRARTRLSDEWGAWELPAPYPAYVGVLS